MGQRESFALSRTMGRMGARVLHPTLDRNTRIALPDLQEMHDEGLIVLELRDKGSGSLRVTGKGHEYAQQLRAREAPAGEPAATGAADWSEEMRPVLQAAYRAYSAAPHPSGITQNAINEQLGRDANDDRTDRALGELAAFGYVEATAAARQQSGPLRCKLTEKAYQQIANWPTGSGDAVAAALLEALDEHIAEASTDEERARLQSLREAARDVGVGALASLLARVAAGL